MLLSNQRQSFGRDGNPVGDALSNVGSPLHVGSPSMSRGDEMLMKVTYFYCRLFIVRKICICIFA